MAYRAETIISKTKTSMDGFLYKKSFINYRGFTTDKPAKKYTEVIAEHLLANLKKYESNIAPISREGSYKIKGHKRHPYDPFDTSIKRKEEHIARSMFGHKFSKLEVLDYQVPLKNVGTKENEGLGKIDLLAWDGKSLVILELKKPDSDETLLRCILEAYTYLKVADKEKLAKDFGHSGVPVRAAALVFIDSQPHKDWLDENQKHVKKLMKKLEIGLYTIDNDTAMNITKVEIFD